MRKAEKFPSMKVDDKYVRGTIEEYHRTLRDINESTTHYPTKEINGSTYYDVDMTSEELFKQMKITDVNDIQWTI